MNEGEFNAALCRRVRALRVKRGWTSEQMALALGIPKDRYRKYEYRSPLPHYLIERFALMVNASIAYVLTGKEPPTNGSAAEPSKRTARR